MSSLKPHLRRLAKVCAAAIALCLAATLAIASEQERTRQAPPTQGEQPSAQAGDLPSAADVLKKYVAATGGEEAYKSLKTQHSVGKISLPDMGLEGTMEQYSQAPDKSLIIMDFTGMGKVTSGLNGKVGWQNDQMMGPRLLEGDQLNSMIRETDPATVLKPEQIYKSMEVKGVEEVDGEKAFRLSLLPKDSPNPIEAWYSVESGLLLKNASVQEGPQGEVSVETKYEDYTDSEGELKIKQPRKMTMTVAGTTLVMTIDKAEANVDIPAEKFELPPEIKQMADKQKAAPPAGGGGDGMGGGGM